MITPLPGDPLGYDVVYLQAATTTLRPILPPDYEWAARLVTDERNRDMVPVPLWDAELPAALDFIYTTTICNFVVAEPANDFPLGVVGVSTGEFSTQAGSLRLLLDPDFPGDPTVHDGVRLFLHYVFTGWNFRKLRAQFPEGTRPLAAIRQALTVDGNPLYVEEGRLSNHLVRENGFADLVMLTLPRTTWEAHRADLTPPPAA